MTHVLIKEAGKLLGCINVCAKNVKICFSYLQCNFHYKTCLFMIRVNRGPAAKTALALFFKEPKFIPCSQAKCRTKNNLDIVYIVASVILWHLCLAPLLPPPRAPWSLAWTLTCIRAVVPQNAVVAPPLMVQGSERINIESMLSRRIYCYFFQRFDDGMRWLPNCSVVFVYYRSFWTPGT